MEKNNYTRGLLMFWSTLSQLIKKKRRLKAQVMLFSLKKGN